MMLPTSNRPWVCLGAFVFLLWLWCNDSLAQTVTGSISGTVVDASEAVIPSAEISLVSERTGETRKTTSAASGDFLFAAVRPGVYTLFGQVTATRFPRVVQLSLRVQF